jgi:hypothetical protein
MWRAVLMGVTACASAFGQPLHFRVDEGRNLNSFVREGEVAAHLLLRSGTDPRVLVAFPAGNSGVGVWFEKTDEPISWALVGTPRAVILEDAKGRLLRGIEVEVDVKASTDASALRPERAVLSSVRVLRDYEALGKVPDEIAVAPVVEGARMTWARDRLDGGAGYRLSIEAVDEGSSRLKIVAVTGETPLTPLSGPALMNADVANDERARNVLSFLSYREKYLAGSWRFNTYFGRDTLISLRLLSPVLQPAALESGVVSVLERLAPNGEVAHEEDIGEFAVLRNSREGRGPIDAPIYDYGMVDDDFLLAPLVAHWFLGGSTPPDRTLSFLANHGNALVRNFMWVVERTSAFASEPKATNLVSIKSGRRTGQWRDSEEGLGRGIYPYDINVALVPAALDAIDRLLSSGLLDEYVSADQRKVLASAKAHRQVWSERSAPLFVVLLAAERAKDAIAAYAATLDVPSSAPLTSIGDHTFAFNAIALDAQGKPIRVMHSDGGFELLFDTPDAARLDRLINTLTRPFPAGLITPAGMLVANPVFTTPDIQARFSNSAYHGTVVWSWQQALMIAGLDRQLARTDLSPEMRRKITAARRQLWQAISATRNLRSSELWSWSFSNGQFRAEPFGLTHTHVDESNAAQLWSTVYLGLR